jgi:hypothetical protein
LVVALWDLLYGLLSLEIVLRNTTTVYNAGIILLKTEEKVRW